MEVSQGTPALAVPEDSQTAETTETVTKEKETIIILHTNDVHCVLDNRIGYDGLYRYKEEMKQQYENVLLVDAGDAIQGGIYGLLIDGIGLEYTADFSIPSSVKEDTNGTFISIDGPYRVKDVWINGEPLDPEKEYSAAMSAFLQEGGDGFSMMKDAEILRYTQKVESGIFAEYIEQTLGGVVLRNTMLSKTESI